MEAGVLEVRAGEAGAPEVGSLERGAFEVRAVQPRSLDVGPPQDRIPEVRQQQAGAPEVRSLEVRRPQVGLEQIGALEVRSAEEGSFEVRPGQHRARQGGMREPDRGLAVVGECAPAENRHRGLDVGRGARAMVAVRAGGGSAGVAVAVSGPRARASRPGRVLADERRQDLDDRAVILGRFLREPLERVDPAEAHVERRVPDLVDGAHEPLGQLALGVLESAVARERLEGVDRHARRRAPRPPPAPRRPAPGSARRAWPCRSGPWSTRATVART